MNRRSRVVVRQDNREVIKQRLRTLKKAKLTVGIHAKDAPTGGPINAATIASIHEYGAQHIPARPFIGPTVRDMKDVYIEIMGDAARAVVRGAPSGAVLGRLGVKVVADIRGTIDAGIDPELADSTKEKRDAKLNGRGPANSVFSGYTPLRDTSQHIYNRLNHEVKS